MSSAQERAKVLADEIKKTMREIKAAEVRVKHLGEELTRVLKDAKAQVEVSRTIVEWPSGRYECKRCKQIVLFTEPTEELPACEHCGARDYTGQEPKITKIEPPPPKQHAAGLYECMSCGARTAYVMDTDELLPCELCGSDRLKPM